MTENWRRLDALGATITPVSPGRIRRLLGELTARVGPLPGAYLEVLERYGGDIDLTDFDVEFEADVPSLWASDGADGVDALYGLVGLDELSVVEALDVFAGRLPDGWMPIGRAAGGMQLCLRVGGDADGAVALWDPEADSRSAAGPAAGMTRVAPTFGDFIRRLRISPHDPESGAVDV